MVLTASYMTQSSINDQEGFVVSKFSWSTRGFASPRGLSLPREVLVSDIVTGKMMEIEVCEY